MATSTAVAPSSEKMKTRLRSTAMNSPIAFSAALIPWSISSGCWEMKSERALADRLDLEALVEDGLLLREEHDFTPKGPASRIAYGVARDYRMPRLRIAFERFRQVQLQQLPQQRLLARG